MPLMNTSETPLEGWPPRAVWDVPLPPSVLLDCDLVEAQRRFVGRSRSDIARQWWGVHPSQASRILDGQQPCTVARLRILGLALGCDPRLLIVSPRKAAA